MFSQKNKLFLTFLAVIGICLSIFANSSSLLNNPFLLQGEKIQSVAINQSFSENAKLDQIQGYTVTLDQNNAIYGAGIDAAIKLFGDASLVRIIMIDKSNEEYMIYETYSLIAEQKNFSIKDACHETKLLSAINPSLLRIEVLDASITLQNVSFVTSLPYTRSELLSLQNQISKEQENQRIDLLNRQIKAKGMEWKAAHTSLSSLTYAEKKQTFDLNKSNILANLQGFEYYAGGVFMVKNTKPDIISPEDPNKKPVFADTFDWRNRHGANREGSPYYNPNQGKDGIDGWISGIRDQAKPKYCGSCWAHSTIGEAEQKVSLYYNQHIDYDLAEQFLMACGNWGGTPGRPCSGGWPTVAASWIGKNGVVDEAAYPYKAADGMKCSDSATRPKEHIMFAGSEDMLKTVKNFDALRKAFITYGPLNFAVNSMSHAMLCVGYIGATGTPTLIFKNSHGVSSGVKGYSYIKNLSFSTFTISRYLYPVKSLVYTDDSIKCLDMDKDGYYWWGLGPKPKTCPSSMMPEEDCDDSNNKLGPMGPDDGICKPAITGIVLNSQTNSGLNYNRSFNPFTRLTTVSFVAPQNAKASVQIYNVSGALVKQLTVSDLENNLKRVVWDGTNANGSYVSNGIYVCTINIDGIQKSTSSFKLAFSR